MSVYTLLLHKGYAGKVKGYCSGGPQRKRWELWNLCFRCSPNHRCTHEEYAAAVIIYWNHDLDLMSSITWKVGLCCVSSLWIHVSFKKQQLFCTWVSEVTIYWNGIQPVQQQLIAHGDLAKFLFKLRSTCMYEQCFPQWQRVSYHNTVNADHPDRAAKGDLFTRSYKITKNWVKKELFQGLYWACVLRPKSMGCGHVII